MLFDQLGELVGARKDRGEVDRVLDRLAGKVADAGTRELRDRLVLALARGERRAGGRLGSGAGATGPGARLVVDMIGAARTTVLDERASETARAGEAVVRLVLLDPVESGSVLVKLLDPREVPAVQVSAVRGLAEIGSADAGGILLPRLRGFEPSVRAAAVQTMLSRADWHEGAAQAVSGDGRAGGRARA